MDITDLLMNFGFPVAVSIYLLWQQNTTIKENSNAINNLSMVLEKYYFENNKKR